MTKKYFLACLVASIFFSCKKHELAEGKFEVTSAVQSKGISLTWQSPHMSGFKNMVVYRSASPIPEPHFADPIPVALIFATITDKNSTGFFDSTVTPNAQGAIYYRVVVNFDNRFQYSEQQEISFNSFTIDMPAELGSSIAVLPFPEANLMYLYRNNCVSVLDYTSKKILETVSISTNYYDMVLCAAMHNGIPELFIGTTTYLKCYDGITLAYKYGMNMAPGMREFKVKDNFLYVLNNGYFLKTYDLSTQALVHSQYPPFKMGKVDVNIYVGGQVNKLYVKYNTSYHDNQTDYNTIKNYIISYNLVNGLPMDSSLLNIPQINTDTLSSANYYKIQISPDGKYMACNDGGDVFCLQDNSLHNIRVGQGSTLPVFSTDGKHVLARQTDLYGNSTGHSFSAYTLPGFSGQALVSGNSINSMVAGEDLMDNDTLLSYNLRADNQGKLKMTVFFKKVN